MFKKPINGGRNLERVIISEFGGLNTAASSRDNEFSELVNLTNEDYPHLKTIPGRKALTGDYRLLAKDYERGFEKRWITAAKVTDDGRVLFKYGPKYQNEGGYETLFQKGTMGPQEQFIMAGGQYLLFPSMGYIKPQMRTDGSYFATSGVCVSQLATSSVGSYQTIDPNGEMACGFNSEGINIYYNYTLSGIRKAFKDGELSVGDSIKIVYTSNDENEELPSGYSASNIYTITAVELEEEEDDKYDRYIRLTLETRNQEGLPVGHKGMEICVPDFLYNDRVITIYKINPFVLGASFGGRLFACDVSGENIWASQYSDVFNFRVDGTDAGASIISCGEPSRWTAIKVYGESVYAFKQDSIYRIDGNGALSYTLTRISDLGALNQSAVAVVGSVLYFLHKSGIYAYSGGEMHLISDAISSELSGVTSGVLGGTGHALYCVINYEMGQRIFVYNGKNGLWHEETIPWGDDNTIYDIIDYAGTVMCASKQSVYQLNLEDGEITNTITPFRLVTKKYFYLFDKKAVGEVNIKMSADNPVTVSVSYDGGEFESVRTMTLSAGIGRVPVKLRKCTMFQIKVEGKGQAEIHSMEFSLYRGGRWF